MNNKFTGGPSVCVYVHNVGEKIQSVTLTMNDCFSFQLAEKNAPLSKLLKEQFEQYIQKKRSSFNVTLYPLEGTSFFLQGLQALKDIPIGKTLSYKELAEKLQRPKAHRAIGNLCHKNPYPFFIPCHRVIGSDGSMRGYAYGEKVKKELLSFENS